MVGLHRETSQRKSDMEINRCVLLTLFLDNLVLNQKSGRKSFVDIIFCLLKTFKKNSLENFKVSFENF